VKHLLIPIVIENATFVFVMEVASNCLFVIIDFPVEANLSSFIALILDIKDPDNRISLSIKLNSRFLDINSV